MDELVEDGMSDAAEDGGFAKAFAEYIAVRRQWDAERKRQRLLLKARYCGDRVGEAIHGFKKIWEFGRTAKKTILRDLSPSAALLVPVQFKLNYDNYLWAKKFAGVYQKKALHELCRQMRVHGFAMTFGHVRALIQRLEHPSELREKVQLQAIQERWSVARLRLEAAARYSEWRSELRRRLLSRAVSGKSPQSQGNT